MSGTGGEPHPDMSKVEGPILFRPDGGRGPTTPICDPTALLGTGGEPRPNLSKVEGPVLLDRMGGEALQCPYVPPQPCQEQEKNLVLT